MQIKTKKIILGILLAVGIVTFTATIQGTPLVQAQFGIPTPTPAFSPPAKPLVLAPTSTDQQAQKELNTIIEVLIIIEKAFLALSIPLNIVIGKLLSNDWVYLDGDAYKAIETMWILMRNIVNVVFACLLLIIAIAQIAGAVSGSESKTFALKQALPGFIFGLIFVNFSLLACKVILDVGNLATTAAFSMVNEVGPNLIAGGNDPNAEKILINKSMCWPSSDGLKQIEQCKGQNGSQLTDCLDKWAKDQIGQDSPLRTCMGEKVYVAFGQKKVAALYNSGNISPESWTGPQPPDFNGDFAMAWSKGGPKDLSQLTFGARNVMMVYTNSIFRMPEILNLYNGKTNLTIGTGGGILMTTLLTLIFGAMIILINIALVMALGIRMVLIWMILIFSPLMALELVSDGKFVKGFLSKAKFDKGLLNGLIGLAFMPAIAGIVLSLGFIIFHVLNKVIYRTTSFTPEGAQTFNIPPFNIEISGSIMPMFSTIGEFIIACILLIILWQALFQMMQTNKYMDGAINKIGKLGETIAGSAKLIPFIPMPGPKQKGQDGKVSSKPVMMSWAGLNRGVDEFERHHSRHMDESSREDVKDSWFGRFMPNADVDSKQKAALQESASRLHKKAAKDQDFTMPINLLVQTHKDGATFTDPESAKDVAGPMKELVQYSTYKEDSPEWKKWMTTWDTWQKAPTNTDNVNAIREELHKLANNTTDNRLREALRKWKIDTPDTGNGFKLSFSDTPPTPTGEPQSQGENKGVHEGTPPSKNNSYHIALTAQLDPTAPARKLDMPAVPQTQLETLWRANEAYQKADVAAKPGLEGPLSAALATVLGHAGVSTIPASLDGTRRSKLADEVLKASKMPAPAAH